MYLLMSSADFVGVQDDLIDIQLDSGDQLKKGPLLLCHLFLTQNFNFKHLTLLLYFKFHKAMSISVWFMPL